jgi:enterochelin esterase-like enzyme
VAERTPRETTHASRTKVTNMDNPETARAAENASTTKWTRRRILALSVGVGAVVVAGGTVSIELVSHGLLPGQQELDQLEGACSVAVPPLRLSGAGTSRSGSFHSKARRRRVGYTIAWPPGHGPATAALPLVVMLHGEGANHTNALTGMSLGQAVSLEVDGEPLPPLAMVTVDGGTGYWNPHPGDDPMAMVVDELIPMCQDLGLGRGGRRSIGIMGISMGGYGGLLLAEKYPSVFGAVAAISPAIWTSYSQAEAVNSSAYTSASAFAANDAVTHAGALVNTAVRVASGLDDPFHPGVVALAGALSPSATVVFSQGCHTGAFFSAEEPASLQFLGSHLA